MPQLRAECGKHINLAEQPPFQQNPSNAHFGQIRLIMSRRWRILSGMLVFQRMCLKAWKLLKRFCNFVADAKQKLPFHNYIDILQGCFF